MGRRMSVTEICARMLPSTNSTSEWTVDCGWMVTRTCAGGQVEEAAGFDDLEALVHHGGGVDGDALAHDPGGVLEGLRRGDVVEVGERRVAEGATGGGEPDLLDFGGGAAAHALVDGVVLGVDGEEGDVVLAGGGDDELAGGYEALLVGEADGLAGADGGVGGFEAGYADDGGDDEVDFGQGGDADGAGGAVDDFDAGDAGGLEAGGEGRRPVLRWPARRPWGASGGIGQRLRRGCGRRRGR